MNMFKETKKTTTSLSGYTSDKNEGYFNTFTKTSNEQDNAKP